MSIAIVEPIDDLLAQEVFDLVYAELSGSKPMPALMAQRIQIGISAGDRKMIDAVDRASEAF